MSTSLRQLERRIEAIRRELLRLGPMRPGSLSRQYRNPQERKRPFYQISYTHRRQSHSEYVRPANLAAVRRETATFKRFRSLIERWVALALQASQYRYRQIKPSTQYSAVEVGTLELLQSQKSGHIIANTSDLR